MSMREMDNANASEQQCVHKYTLNQQYKHEVKNKYVNSKITAIDFSRRLEYEPSTSKTFLKPILLDYKIAAVRSISAILVLNYVFEDRCYEGLTNKGQSLQKCCKQDNEQSSEKYFAYKKVVSR